MENERLKTEAIFASGNLTIFRREYTFGERTIFVEVKFNKIDGYEWYIFADDQKTILQGGLPSDVSGLFDLDKGDNPLFDRRYIRAIMVMFLLKNIPRAWARKVFKTYGYFPDVEKMKGSFARVTNTAEFAALRGLPEGE